MINKLDYIDNWMWAEVKEDSGLFGYMKAG